MSAQAPLSLWVPGQPKTKGSMTARPGPLCRCCPACRARVFTGAMGEGVRGSSAWRDLVARGARDAMALVGWVTVAWPDRVMVSARFVVSGAGSRPGDVDKLARNALDALTDARVYADDAQVSHLVAWRELASLVEAPGLALTVTELPRLGGGS